MSAEVAHQLSIFVANKPGVLGKVCDLLKKEKINIYAITTSDNRDHSIIRLVVDEPHRALGLLEDYGTLVQQTDVIMIDGPNRPGTIGEMARRLGRGEHQHRLSLLRHCADREARPFSLQAVERGEGAQGAEPAVGIDGGPRGQSGHFRRNCLMIVATGKIQWNSSRWYSVGG